MREAVSYNIPQDIIDCKQPMAIVLAERLRQCIVVDCEAAFQVLRSFLRGVVSKVNPVVIAPPCRVLTS